jgi:hypothetical protein
MNELATPNVMTPVTRAECIATLDVLRGLALCWPELRRARAAAPLVASW